MDVDASIDRTKKEGKRFTYLEIDKLQMFSWRGCACPLGRLRCWNDRNATAVDVV